MANSSFQKVNLPSVLSPDKGGTGVTSLTDKGVIIGAGTGSVTSVSPGVSGNVLKSDGTSWISGTGVSLLDASVSYAKLATDLTQIVAMGANDVDWSQGSIFTKTLASNTTLTFSNYKLDKNIILKIDGNYTLVFPSSVIILGGTYTGSAINYITLHCTNSSSGSEEVWATINQGVVTINGYGYFIAGYSSGSITNLANRIVFSTGVTSVNTVSNLSLAKYALAGLSDVSTYGYFSGGLTGTVGDGTEHVATTHRIVFSTGVTSANTISNLSQARSYLSGVSDGVIYGYFAGGYIGTSANVNTADRIVFSTSVTSVNTVSNISAARRVGASLSDGTTYGYFSGGTSTAANATTDRIVFSTGVTSLNTVSNLSQARYGLAGLSDSYFYGYFLGGDTGAFTNITDRIVFSTGVTSLNTVSNLSQARGYFAGSSDGALYGYVAGGTTNSSAGVTTADRIVFSTGAASANTVSNLSQAIGYFTGISDCVV